jgi:hypothetical protein
MAASRVDEPMPGQWPREPDQGAAAFVFDERGRILLVHENYDRRRYGRPGGAG